MEKDNIERIRSATFTVGRRGYEKREVDTFLARVADWLEAGGGDRARSDTIKRELERVGQRTSKILAAAEEAAEGIRLDAEAAATDLMNEARTRSDATRTSADKYAKETREDADSHSEKERRDAESYSQGARADADAYSEEMLREAKRQASEHVAEAKAAAERTVEEGARRRREVETVISDLEKRRDAVLAGLEQLSTELAGAATHHRPVGDERAATTVEDAPTRKMAREAAAPPEEPASAP